MNLPVFFSLFLSSYEKVFLFEKLILFDMNCSTIKNDLFTRGNVGISSSII